MRTLQTIFWIPLLLLFAGGVQAQSGMAGKRLQPEDVAWLQRVTYGINTESSDEYLRLGRKAFLKQQLAPGDDSALPAAVRASIDGLAMIALPIPERMAAVQAENKRINAMTAEAGGNLEQQKSAARDALNQSATQSLNETRKRHMLRAVYSPWQVKEKMTWFWMNHFSVFGPKANVRWTAANYEDSAIRPNALGKFRDLVMATLTHPAMMEYLDNAQSAAGKINENYARELLELHTLGLDGGYSQQDVQELARILTGAGVNFASNTADVRAKLKPEWQPLYKAQNGFEFNPARHDFGDKTFLGQAIPGSGFAEIETVIDRLASHPSTARFVSKKIAAYFVGDDPAPALVERMSRTFLKSQGDIAAVLATLFDSREFTASLGNKFSDPMQYVVSAMRFAYDDKVVTNLKPVTGWLQQLGEPLYGRVTPDGYSMAQSAWISPGQMSKRFEIARAIGSDNAGLFTAEDGKPSERTGFPLLTNRLYFNVLEPALSAPTRQALARAASQDEFNALLLSSPDWMNR
jgi:uncharacterized protein (DUF1800 family)